MYETEQFEKVGAIRNGLFEFASGCTNSYGKPTSCSRVNWVWLPIKNSTVLKFTSSYVHTVLTWHQPSKMDRNHGEKWLPTTLNNTVTRRILNFLAMVIFIPWPLRSYRYHTCHHQPDIEKKLASWSQTNSIYLAFFYLCSTLYKRINTLLLIDEAGMAETSPSNTSIVGRISRASAVLQFPAYLVLDT